MTAPNNRQTALPGFDNEPIRLVIERKPCPDLPARLASIYRMLLSDDIPADNEPGEHQRPVPEPGEQEREP
jgi:hypothetical protein